MDPGRPGRRALVLLAERRRRGAADVPRPRAAAHHARPARGVSPRGRHAVHPRLCERRDAESVRPLQRRVPVRRAARVRAPRRRAAARDGALRADRRASRPAPAGPCPRPAEGSELHARAARSAQPRPALVPARRPDEGGDARRGRGGGARGRAAAREPGGVFPRAATTTARFSAGAGLTAEPGDIVDEAGRRVGTHDGYWRFTPGQRRGLGVSAAEPLYALVDRRAVEHGHRRAAQLARPDARLGPGAAVCGGRPGRGEAPLRLAGGRRVGRADGVRVPAAARRARLRGRARARRRCSTTDDVVVGSGLVTSAAADVGLPAMAARLRLRERRVHRPDGVPRRGRARPGLGVSAAGDDVRPPLVADPRRRARGAAGDQQGRRLRRPGQRAARQARPGDRQRRRARSRRSTRRCERSARRSSGRRRRPPVSPPASRTAGRGSARATTGATRSTRREPPPPAASRTSRTSSGGAQADAPPSTPGPNSARSTSHCPRGPTPGARHRAVRSATRVRRSSTSVSWDAAPRGGKRLPVDCLPCGRPPNCARRFRRSTPNAGICACPRTR